MDVSVIILSALLILAVWWVIDQSRQSDKDQANLDALRNRLRGTPGLGMIPAAEVAGQPITWAEPNAKVWGLLEYKLRAGDRLLARYWLAENYELLEAETCEGWWETEYQARGCGSSVFEQDFILRSALTGSEEAHISSGLSSQTILGSLVSNVVFSDGCAFTCKTISSFSREGSLPFPWPRWKRVLLDRDNRIVLQFTRSDQVTIAKEAQSNHHLTLLALLVSYLAVHAAEMSSD